MATKTCIECNKEKTLECFSENRKKCKECRKQSLLALQRTKEGVVKRITTHRKPIQRKEGIDLLNTV